MKIELHEITVSEVADKYTDSRGRVIGYNGRLNIRPKYQREFIYDEKKRNAVLVPSARISAQCNVMGKK